MTLMIELSPELKQRLEEQAAQRGQSPDDYARQALEEKLAATQTERNQAAMALLDRWLAEAPDEEDETWSEFQAALESHHSSDRKLFSE